MQVELSRDLERARRVARLLDSAFQIPIVGVRLGVDPLLGLIPGLGDAIGALLSSYPVILALRHRLPRFVVLRMLGTIAIDALVGAIPIIGDLFDIAFKSNLRNQRLIERYALEPARTERLSSGLVWAAIGAVILIVMALVALTIWLVSAGLARITG